MTKEELTNSRYLAEQQENQRATKFQKISKQTHDKKSTEKFSHITKKLDIVIENNNNFGDIAKHLNCENETSQLAIEITQKVIKSGVLYDTALENSIK